MHSKKQLTEILFPYDSIREQQDAMVFSIVKSLEKKQNAIIHAPTGIGKTVSALAPALRFALQHKLTVFFLTSRQTQHMIALETLWDIKKKYDITFHVADLIAKKHMCLQEVENLGSGDFLEFCKKVRERKECAFYLNAKKPSGQPTLLAESVVSDLKTKGPLSVAEIISHCEKPALCPYEMSALMAKDASVIIADYNLLFHPHIRRSFVSRSSKTLKDAILIIDEAHNLPSRCREILTSKISSFMLDRAIKEAQRFHYLDLAKKVMQFKEAVDHIGRDLNFNQEEKLIRKHELLDHLEEHEEFASLLSKAAEDVRSKQKQSYLGGVAEFLTSWVGPDLGFARIAKKDEQGGMQLLYRCLDPTLLTKEVVGEAYATIAMSGTLQPASMYKDVLGFQNCIEEEFENPYPKENRLCLIVPETTTKFSKRSDEQYKHIAACVNSIISKVPGNIALFFPSYQILNQVYRYLYHLCKKKMFIEKSTLSQSERVQLIESFKLEQKKGAVLLAVSSGSFGEGIDLPGDLLKGVVVVGLPLEKPDLETKELIDYYEDRYGRGLDYGYIFPAFIKCLQNAGRCIRSETDRGIIVFLDERFAWQNYMRCFPKDMDVKITKLYEKRISEFFGNE